MYSKINLKDPFMLANLLEEELSSSTVPVEILKQLLNVLTLKQLKSFCKNSDYPLTGKTRKHEVLDAIILGIEQQQLQQSMVENFLDQAGSYGEQFVFLFRLNEEEFGNKFNQDTISRRLREQDRLTLLNAKQIPLLPAKEGLPIIDKIEISTGIIRVRFVQKVKYYGTFHEETVSDEDSTRLLGYKPISYIRSISTIVIDILQNRATLFAYGRNFKEAKVNKDYVISQFNQVFEVQLPSSISLESLMKVTIENSERIGQNYYNVDGTKTSHKGSATHTLENSTITQEQENILEESGSVRNVKKIRFPEDSEGILKDNFELGINTDNEPQYLYFKARHYKDEVDYVFSRVWRALSTKP